MPLRLTGFNRDVVVERGSVGPPYTTAQSFDLGIIDPFDNNALYEVGLDGLPRGLPSSGEIRVDSIDADFQLASYTENNSARLGDGVSSLELTLDPADQGAYVRLAVLASSGNAFGARSDQLMLRFEDGTTRTVSVNTHDWFGGTTNVALLGFGRVSLHAGGDDSGPANPRFYYTLIDLLPSEQFKTLVGFRFSQPSPASDRFPNLLAISGESTPGFIRGDADGSGAVNLVDGIFLLNYLVADGSAPPAPLDRADFNDNELITFADAFLILCNQLAGCADPPSPHPQAGSDPDERLRDLATPRDGMNVLLNASIDGDSLVVDIELESPDPLAGFQFVLELSRSWNAASGTFELSEEYLGDVTTHYWSESAGLARGWRLGLVVFANTGAPRPSILPASSGVPVSVGRLVFSRAGPDRDDEPVIWVDDTTHRGIRYRPTMATSELAEYQPGHRIEIEGVGGPVFRRGEANGDGVIDLSDGVFVLAWLFLGADAPACVDGADANDDGFVDLSDPIQIFGWLFLGGPPPPAPGPTSCGVDETDDGLDCAVGASCL